MAKKKEPKVKKATLETIRSLLRDSEKIKAVGIFMREAGCSLAEAKRVIDAEESALGLKKQSCSDEEMVQLSEKVHAEQFPDLGLHREGVPYLTEEWSISHLGNSPVFAYSGESAHRIRRNPRGDSGPKRACNPEARRRRSVATRDV